MREEIKYWLTELVNENPIDELGKKAEKILENPNKMDKLSDLLDKDEALWKFVHRSYKRSYKRNGVK